MTGAGNKITVLIFVQGKKLEESQRTSILDMLEEYDEEFGGLLILFLLLYKNFWFWVQFWFEFPDVQVSYTSSKYPRSDFEKFMLDNDPANFIPIQPQNSGNLSDSASVFVKEFLKSAEFTTILS